MADKSDKIKYKKLIGMKSSFLFRASLWLGPDHLLMVTSMSSTEEYKRFFFQDIQAVVMAKTDKWKIIGLITGLLGALFVPAAILSEGGRMIFSWILAVPSILIFIVNLVLGPTCDSYILTAVQKEKIYPVKRTRAFRKIVKKIRPLIEDAQGRLEPETFENYMARLI